MGRLHILEFFNLAYNRYKFYVYRCCCGLSLTFHCGTGAQIERTDPNEVWSPAKHTLPSPTDAYGTIEFQGGPHPSKAQV